MTESCVSELPYKQTKWGKHNAEAHNMPMQTSPQTQRKSGLSLSDIHGFEILVKAVRFFYFLKESWKPNDWSDIYPLPLSKCKKKVPWLQWESDQRHNEPNPVFSFTLASHSLSWSYTAQNLHLSMLQCKSPWLQWHMSSWSFAFMQTPIHSFCNSTLILHTFLHTSQNRFSRNE